MEGACESTIMSLIKILFQFNKLNSLHSELFPTKPAMLEF